MFILRVLIRGFAGGSAGAWACRDLTWTVTSGREPLRRGPPPHRGAQIVQPLLKPCVHRRGEGGVLLLWCVAVLAKKKEKVLINHIIDCNGLRIEGNAGRKDEEQNVTAQKGGRRGTGERRQPRDRCWGGDDQCQGKRIMITPEKATRSHSFVFFPILNLSKFW